MVMRIPVLAENLRMFNLYIESNKLNRGHFDYVVGQGSIRGRRGVILTVGKWWRNPTYRNQDFYEALTSIVNVGGISLVPAMWDIEDNRNLL